MLVDLQSNRQPGTSGNGGLMGAADITHAAVGQLFQYTCASHFSRSFYRPELSLLTLTQQLPKKPHPSTTQVSRQRIWTPCLAVFSFEATAPVLRAHGCDSARRQSTANKTHLGKNALFLDNVQRARWLCSVTLRLPVKHFGCHRSLYVGRL